MGHIPVEMKLKYALCIVMLLSRQVVGDESTRTYNITDRVYTCSSWLAMVISKFCDNVYKITKRDTSLMIDMLTPRSLLEKRDLERALTQERWRRVRRQIASECCDQPCTVATIIMYCPKDSKLLQERPDIFN